jgi:hypothetical protein
MHRACHSLRGWCRTARRAWAHAGAPSPNLLRDRRIERAPRSDGRRARCTRRSGFAVDSTRNVRRPGQVQDRSRKAPPLRVRAWLDGLSHGGWATVRGWCHWRTASGRNCAAGAHCWQRRDSIARPENLVDGFPVRLRRRNAGQTVFGPSVWLEHASVGVRSQRVAGRCGGRSPVPCVWVEHSADGFRTLARGWRLERTVPGPAAVARGIGGPLPDPGGRPESMTGPLREPESWLESLAAGSRAPTRGWQIQRAAPPP